MLLSLVLFTQLMHRGLCRVDFWNFLYRNVFSLSMLMSGARRWVSSPMHLISASSDIGGEVIQAMLCFLLIPSFAFGFLVKAQRNQN